jgi:hypothetical protein
MYKKKWICKKCGYETNKKQNYDTHIGRQAACEKRIKRLSNETDGQNATLMGQNPTLVGQNATLVGQNATLMGQNATLQSMNELNCSACNKKLSCFKSLNRHLKICKGVNSLQCPTCKKTFSNSGAKSRHMKNVKCEPVLTEDQQRIKELEEELKEKEKLEEELKEKDKQLEEARARPTTIYNTTNNNNNNYFDHSINHNNYDNLNVDHITKEDIKRLFDKCRMQYPELSEDLTRMILRPKENQCIYLPEGQKSNTCAVIKDGVEMRKPLIRVLNDLGVQTATLIRDSNVIVRNKKDVVNNQFWADNRNACGLNISDIEYMTDNDKEIAQRNKNVVLDMCEGKIC